MSNPVSSFRWACEMIHALEPWQIARRRYADEADVLTCRHIFIFQTLSCFNSFHAWAVVSIIAFFRTCRDPCHAGNAQADLCAACGYGVCGRLWSTSRLRLPSAFSCESDKLKHPFKSMVAGCCRVCVVSDLSVRSNRLAWHWYLL